MHSCLSLSLLHHSEGGFYLISLCSKNFPVFLSSVFSEKKKPKWTPQTNVICKTFILSLSDPEYSLSQVWLGRRGWGKEGKVEAWIKQKRGCILTKQKNWSQFPAKQQKNLSVLCFKISGSSEEQFFFYWVLKCTQQTFIWSLVRCENYWTFVFNTSANFYSFSQTAFGVFL